MNGQSGFKIEFTCASNEGRADEVSTQVRWSIRSARVTGSPPGEIVAPSVVMVVAPAAAASASPSGAAAASRGGMGVVRARAMLQLFAPRSRTLGNLRFMS